MTMHAALRAKDSICSNLSQVGWVDFAATAIISIILKYDK